MPLDAAPPPSRSAMFHQRNLTLNLQQRLRFTVTARKPGTHPSLEPGQIVTVQRVQGHSHDDQGHEEVG